MLNSSNLQIQNLDQIQMMMIISLAPVLAFPQSHEFEGVKGLGTVSVLTFVWHMLNMLQSQISRLIST